MEDENRDRFTTGHVIEMPCRSNAIVRLADGRVLGVHFRRDIQAALESSRNRLDIADGTPVVLEQCPFDDERYRIVDFGES